GPRLLRLLEQPTVLTRNPVKARQSLGDLAGNCQGWDLLKEPAPVAALDGADVVFHLAGESVAGGRWTSARKQAIRDTRVTGTNNLVAGLAKCAQKPRVLVSASAVGYYGDRGDEILNEQSPPASDYLAEVCLAWEEAALQAEKLGIRVVTARIGIVLGKNGGALAQMLPPFRWGVGGPLGNGKMWMPWVHIDDLAGLLLHAAEHEGISGAMNAVAPNAVRNAEFTKALAAALHRPAFLPIPYFGLRVLFGEFAKILFASQHVVPQVANQTGYEFLYPTIESALAEVILGKSAPSRRPVPSHSA
ncbi:MAG: TIGR01777 family oxidoreductase, partial [Pirellulales bacterium]|nr:TIGR01777 family oxidoreductase [Pirellulales bacterium]